jgi:hypothetical protein
MPSIPDVLFNSFDGGGEVKRVLSLTLDVTFQKKFSFLPDRRQERRNVKLETLTNCGTMTNGIFPAHESLFLTMQRHGYVLS